MWLNAKCQLLRVGRDVVVRCVGGDGSRADSLLLFFVSSVWSLRCHRADFSNWECVWLKVVFLEGPSRALALSFLGLCVYVVYNWVFHASVTFFGVCEPVARRARVRVRVVGDPALGVRVPTAPSSLRDYGVAEVSRGEVEHVGKREVLFRVFRSCFLQVGVVCGALRVLHRVRSRISCVRSRGFKFLGLLQGLVRQVIRGSFRHIPRGNRFRVIVCLLQTEGRVLPFF